MYPYGLIGNCQASALVHESGSIDWFCAPRPDSPPIFGKLLDPEGGEFSISATESSTFKQIYVPNTNVLVTQITSKDGAFKITDFCPRFEQFGRMYRPISIFRIVEPVTGSPVIKARCRPVNGWDKSPVSPIRGNSHVRYEFPKDALRLTTTMPLTNLLEESPFRLNEPVFFALTWSVGLEDDLVQVAKDFLSKTERYWRAWVKHCSIPVDFQKETIRSALALKLHCYEETGAILAAATTSLPEEIGKGRNWDYRLCWLRDSYYTLSAFHRLGHFEEMEGFLKFLLGVVHSHGRLRPVYRIDGSIPVPEIEHENWTGFQNSPPVRSNNEATNQIQNDMYGEMVLTLAPIFFDERFHYLRTKEHEELLEHLALQCSESISKPDAGLWELRKGGQEHSFTNLMCWAGLDRVLSLQSKGYFKGISFDVAKERERAEKATRTAVREATFRNGPSDHSFNAALFQAPLLRFPDKALSVQTVKSCYEALRVSPEGDSRYFLYRYQRPDDFGVPESAFLLCSFWWIQALTRIGEIGAAREALAKALEAANPLGLFSEHFSPATKTQLGNYPQTYSHVGAINSAFMVSPSWDEIL